MPITITITRIRLEISFMDFQQNKQKRNFKNQLQQGDKI